MIADSFTALTTRCSPHLRGIGYLDETLAMRKRSRKRHAAWQPHLKRSREFVLAASYACPARNKIVIFGSGLLLDVPLAELANLFREVVLVDVICLPEVRKEISHHPNAVFVEHDVTGISGRLFRNSRQRLIDLPEVKTASFQPLRDADLVVSLNILSQLWVIPRAFVMKQRIRADQEQLDDWCAKLVEAHYAFLGSLPCPVCLIADHEFIKRDKEGAVISSGSSVYDLALSPPDTSWVWEIAPIGTESDYYSKELAVAAWHFPRR